MGAEEAVGSLPWEQVITEVAQKRSDFRPEDRQGARPASQNGLHGPAMGGKDLCAKLPFILRPMPAQNLGQFNHWRS